MGSRKGSVSSVRVSARGQDFRVVQVRGNLFVCSRENGSCCCGWDEKGRMPFDNSLWSDEWERRAIRNRLHLTFTGCLGSCVSGNNALLPGLKPEYAEMIELLDLQDRTPESVARELGLTMSNLKVRRHRARKALREELEKTCGTCANGMCVGACSC